METSRELETGVSFFVLARVNVKIELLVRVLRCSKNASLLRLQFWKSEFNIRRSLQRFGNHYVDSPRK